MAFSGDFLGIYTFSVATSFVFEISARSLVFCLNAYDSQGKYLVHGMCTCGSKLVTLAKENLCFDDAMTKGTLLCKATSGNQIVPSQNCKFINWI